MKTELRAGGRTALARTFTRALVALGAVMLLPGAVVAAPATNASPAKPPASAACDRACLIGIADSYMDALVKQDAARLPWARIVRYSENGIPMIVGDGQWSTVTGKSSAPLYVADPETGSVAWLGLVEEHGQPAWYAARLRIEHGQITEVESVIAPKFMPGPFGNPDTYAHDPAFESTLQPAERSARADLIGLVDSYYDAMQKYDSAVLEHLSRHCARIENGASLAERDGKESAGARSCRTQLEHAYYGPDARVRDRRFPVVDVERGLVVASAFVDQPARRLEFEAADGKKHVSPVRYPRSVALIEVFRVRNGAIERIEAISCQVPYGMPSPWAQ